MEKNRVCKICSRCFCSGKAMGGHMRSHFAKLPLPPPPKLNHNPPPPPPPPPRSNASPSPPAHVRSDSDHLFLQFQGNNHHSSRDRNPLRSTGIDETKPKLRQKRASVTPEHVPSTEALSEEDVALCLMMLSRDWWKARGADADGADEEADDCSDDDDEDDSAFGRTQGRSQGEYRCETCNRCFRSYQALGGHRASHTNSNYAITGANRRIFECPFCYRLFDSGQALGGHKKVHHLSHSSNATHSASAVTHKSRIDLNLPVQPEEEDEEVLSEFEFARVTNDDEADMFRPIKRRIFRLR